MASFGQTVGWDIDLLSGYRHVFAWSPGKPHPEQRLSLLAPGTAIRILARRFDVLVLFGWAYPVNWLAAIAAQAAGTPLLLYSDTDVRHAASTPREPLRRAALSWLCSAAAGALCTGTFNRDFYVRLGISPERLWPSPLAVDIDRFGAPGRAAARESLGLERDRVYFLFVGALIERKRPDLLVEAVARLEHEGQRVGLIVAGTGPVLDRVRYAAARLDAAHLLGFVNQSPLPSVYAAADVFVLPSCQEPHGTVVNEAMAAGLPVVVSSGTGVWGPCDLVMHGREGFVFERDNLEGLLAACRGLLNPERRLRMGLAARERVRECSYETAVAGWHTAIGAVTRGQHWPLPETLPND